MAQPPEYTRCFSCHPHEEGVRYAVRERRAVKPRQGITCDQAIVLTSTHGAKRYPGALRRIGYRDAETGKHYVFLTNHCGHLRGKMADRAVLQVDQATPDLITTQATPSLSSFSGIGGVLSAT